MINTTIFPNVKQNENTIWYDDNISDVSYPVENSDLVFQVEDGSFWYQHRNKVVFEVIKKLGITSPFYDIGGGNGVFSIYLQNKGYDVTLIEPNQSAVVNAKKRGVHNVICANFETLSFTEQSLKNVILFDVLEHIENDYSFLEKLYSAMEPQGKLIITVPAFMLFWSNFDINVGHFRRYNIQSLTKRLNKSGFEIQFKSYLFFLLTVPIFLLRRLPYVLKIKHTTKTVNKKNHIVKKGLFHKLMSIFFDLEFRRISSLKKIPFGTTVFIIAEKK